MREILNLQVGQCGNNIGTKFWKLITNEHGINAKNGVYEGECDLQLRRIEVYFNCGSQGRYVPRSVMIDLDTSSLDHIVNSSIGDLFQPDQFVGGKASSSNNFAKGFYTNGTELIDQIMEIIRLEVENCDMLQGFQMLHSLGGGTGSGLGALVLSKIQEEWPDRIISTISIVASPKITESVLEPYNSLFGLRALISTSSESILCDNESLTRICLTKLRRPSATHSDMNCIIGRTISTITSCLRFPGQLNSDLRKIAVNLIPFPNLHFFLSSYAPLGHLYHLYKDMNAKSVIKDLFRDSNMMLNTNSFEGKYITAAVIVRGRVSTREVEQTIFNIQDKRHIDFVDYIPSNISSAICDINPKKSQISAACLGNHSGIASIFDEIHNRFGLMFNKKAYLHWLTAEGLEYDEIKASSESVIKVINEYQTTAHNTTYPDEFDSRQQKYMYQKVELKKRNQMNYSDQSKLVKSSHFPVKPLVRPNEDAGGEKTDKDLDSLSWQISDELSLLNYNLSPY